MFINLFIEPWDSPMITKSVSQNTNCAVIEWIPPLQPNGVITEYQVTASICMLLSQRFPDFELLKITK